MATITTTDGTEIFYKDWGSGQPIVFSHGWPLSSDDWANRSEFYRALPSGPFYNYDKPGVEPSQAIIDNWWRQGMMGDALSHYD
ncbi:MAG: alpha/beta hydrolase, partial [Mycobacterium sp.]